MPSPSLSRSDAPTPPRAVILMLHGGKDRSDQVVDGRSASWRRCRSMQRAISRRALTDGVSTWLLRYRHRGWNGGHGPVEDARWALSEVRRELGELPVVLLGHSMGARTSVHVADHDSVVGVVGLAPWFPPGERVGGLAGRLEEIQRDFAVVAHPLNGAPSCSHCRRAYSAPTPKSSGPPFTCTIFSLRMKTTIG